MEDQAKQALSYLLDRAVKSVDQAVAFSQAQIPDVVEQLLMWKFAESLIATLLPWAVTIAIAYIAVKNIKKAGPRVSRDNDGMYPYIPNEHWNSNGEPTMKNFATIILPFGLSVFGALVSLIFTNLTWLQILIAPKLYLLEYAAELVK